MTIKIIKRKGFALSLIVFPLMLLIGFALQRGGYGRCSGGGDIDGVILVNPPVQMKRAKGMSPSISDYFKYALYYAFAPHKPVVNMAGNPALIKDEAERLEAEAKGRDPLLMKYFSLYSMSQSRKLTVLKAVDKIQGWISAL